MTADHHLINTIKIHFARKSSAQLQAIAMFENQDRWSPEAITAAREVLLDRAAGLAQEPAMPEEEPPLPPAHPDPYSLAFLVTFGAFSGMNGLGFLPVYRVDYTEGADRTDPDLPLPFGSKTAWLALDTRDTEAVAPALGLRDVRAATWAEGIDAAYQSSVFVTPPLADWTLAAGTALFPPDRVETFVKPLLERLSRRFGDAQYFCTHRDFELHVWARARQGQLVRGYGWLGKKGLTLWNEGRQTKEERDLGFTFVDGRSTVVEQTDSANVTLPDESGVMHLASLWSIDPTGLDELFKEPVTGFVGQCGRGRTPKELLKLAARRSSLTPACHVRAPVSFLPWRR